MPPAIDYPDTGAGFCGARNRREIQRMIDWEGILARDGPAAWRTAWRVLGNRADADDVLQETFVAAVEYARKHPVPHWRGLLQHLATARAVDRLRQKARRRGREEHLPDD